MAKDKEPVKKKVGNTYATTEFRHKDDFDQVVEVGEDISNEAPERIAALIELGYAETYVEPQKPSDPPK